MALMIFLLQFGTSVSEILATLSLLTGDTITRRVLIHIFDAPNCVRNVPADIICIHIISLTRCTKSDCSSEEFA